MVVLLVDSLAKEFPFLVRWFYLLNHRLGSLTSVFFLFFCAEFSYHGETQHAGGIR
jgi:hypothetical protein